jgi:uncharacterized protein DUF6232
MSESIYYSKDGIQITNARAVFGSKTYALANVTSVSMGEAPRNLRGAAWLAVIGLAVMVLGASGAGLYLGLIAVVAAMIMAVVAKPKYVVKIGSASGESHALISSDRTEVEQIVAAMNNAIVQRG